MAEARDVSGHIAHHIYTNFRSYRDWFNQITLGANERFESAAWLEVQHAGAQRLSLYKNFADIAIERVKVGRTSPTHDDWVRAKDVYVQLIATQPDYELAETFYNSVHRDVTNDRDVNDAEMFVYPAFEHPPIGPPRSIWTQYEAAGDVVNMVRTILCDFGFTAPWQNIDRDIANVLRSLSEARPKIETVAGLRLEILRSVFYRNKGAYLVGRLVYRSHVWPMVLPILLDESGKLYVDTLITDVDELSVVFSFTRSYFMVHCEYPSALIDFLSNLLPDKKRDELYASVGWHKHGKTEFYRGFLDHLARSDDLFEIAAGVKGMVMSVFTLESYQTVFKVIKDEFASQKDITEEVVRQKYTIVKQHDRVGRMADTQEFSNFSFPRSRFSDELIEELLNVAPSKVVLHDDRIVIKHLYTERMMIPLNLYIDSASDDEIAEALEEYGNAIKQLAAANIFPGDMLLKNFGVTRHGRVVFYDYDEICYLTEVKFREIPQPRTPEEEMSSEPWYAVGRNDVFPEEFQRFLFGRPGIKKLFTEMHGDLFDAGYWQRLQDEVLAGHVTDVFPYRRKRRFGHRSATSMTGMQEAGQRGPPPVP